jgi:DUF1680 family protein
VAVASASGYLVVRRRWQPGDELLLELVMTPRVVTPHPRIDAVRGCAALERGPLVYCIEGADQRSGVSFDDLRLDLAAPVREAWVDDPVPGMVALRATGVHRAVGGPVAWPYSDARAGWAAGVTGGVPDELTAIPYAFWGNRSPGPMRVWIPVAG